MPDSTNKPNSNKRPLVTASTAPTKGKLVGQNYATPDMVAKVTGKAKYAEDFRADGMLFAKLLLSPYPHARVVNIDASEALAMPGVKGMLTMDDLPAPADFITDLGVVIKANKRGERGLAMEPVYQGEPILAVAAVDELTAADAIEKIHVTYEPLPFVVDPFVSLRPGGPNARTDGNTWMRPEAPAPKPGERPGPLRRWRCVEVKWTEEDFKDYAQGKMPMGKPTDEWTYGDLDAGFKNAALVLDETFVTPDTSHQTLEPRTAMAYWQGGKLFVHAGTQSTIQTVPAIARWMQMNPEDIVLISEYTGGGFGSKITANIHVMIPAILSKKCNAPVMLRISREDEHYHRQGASQPDRPFEVRIRQGRPHHRPGHVRGLRQRPVRSGGRRQHGGTDRVPAVPAACHALARNFGSDQHPSARGAEFSGGMQGITLMEPLLAKAARQLKVDQVDIRRINAPEGKAEFGPPVRGKRGYPTSCFMKDALESGAEMFRWKERLALSGVGTAPRFAESASPAARLSAAPKVTTAFLSSSRMGRCTSSRASATWAP